MKIIQFLFGLAVNETFAPASLCVVHKKIRTQAGWVEAPENLPAGELFSGMSVLETDGFNWWTLTGNGKTARIEKSIDGGCRYVYFNNVDRNAASMKCLLVTGDVARDAVEINVHADIVPRPNGIITIFNNAIVNGVHWESFQGNENLSNLGWQYGLSKVTDADSFSGLVYLPARGRNYNQHGSRRNYINITTDESIPLSTDLEGNSQMLTHADYCISNLDEKDPDVELFSIGAVWTVGGSPKNMATPLFIDVKSILQVK